MSVFFAPDSVYLIRGNVHAIFHVSILHRNPGDILWTSPDSYSLGNDCVPSQDRENFVFLRIRKDMVEMDVCILLWLAMSVPLEVLGGGRRGILLTVVRCPRGDNVPF